jgi:class 3 adenylate cyclase
MELAGFFGDLAQRVPDPSGPSQPWQDEVVEAVNECFDSKTGNLNPSLSPLIPVKRTAAFKGALRTLRERAGRYSPVNNPEIKTALDQVFCVLNEIATPVTSASTRADDQTLLDYCVEYEFRTGKSTPVAEVQFEFESLSTDSILASLEGLDRAGLIQLGGHNRELVHLKRQGVLSCSGSAQWNDLGQRLLSYMRGRVLAERTDFGEYTWEQLKAAGVASSDDEFPSFERIISIFSLHSGGSHTVGPPPKAVWRSPSFLVQLRSIQTLVQLHSVLVDLWEKPEAKNSPAMHRPPIAEDAATLASLLLQQYRDHPGPSLPAFESQDLATLLGWKPLRFNNAMNLLAKRGWLLLDEAMGSHPFAAQGFELTEEGVLAFEQAELDASKESGHHLRVPDLKTETLSILFMDLSGWSKLRPPQITTYLEKALPKLDSLVRRHGAQHINTWGDALVVTFGSARDAAECALDIRDFFRRTPETEGIPAGLSPRIALHVGEVINAYNPLIKRSDVFGHAVHLAARLEPVTAKGQVFCTAEFAAALEGIKGMGAAAHAVGKVQLPKDFGEVEVFAVVGPGEEAPIGTVVTTAPSTKPATESVAALGDDETRTLLRVMLKKMPAQPTALTYAEIIARCHPAVTRQAIQRTVVDAAADTNWQVTAHQETVAFEYTMPSPIISSQPRRGW